MLNTRFKLASFVFLGLATVAAAAAIATGAFNGTASAAYDGSLMPPNVPIRQFSLSDQNGNTVSLEKLKGQPLLLTFLFTTCPDMCPLTAQQIRGALDQSGSKMPVVAVSVDPKSDTPAAVRSWLTEQHMAGRMTWGLGTPAQLEKVWKDYAVLGQTASSDHSTYVFVLDRDGRRCVSWPLSQLTPEGLAHDIKLIESRGGSCQA